MVMTRNHGVGQVPGVVEMNPTSFPELFKPSRDLRNLEKSKILGVKMFRNIRKIASERFSWKTHEFPGIPGVKPILLDLENLFLPSRDLKNRRKTQKLEVNNFKIFEKN